jgi:monoamine oxidase
MSSFRTDVVVVGAGAAGLAAARALRERGIATLLLEARDRAGGRAFTVRSNTGEYPIEYGAEFIHGAASSTRALLTETGEREILLDDSDADDEASDRNDAWDAVEGCLAGVDLDGPDMSVDAFLAGLRGVTPETVDGVRMLLEGFDAAITSDASTIGVAREWRSGVNDTSARPVNGYAPIVEHLVRLLGDAVLMETVVTRITWSRGRVTIDAQRNGGPIQIEARRAIITVPIGVLKSDGIVFDPALPDATLKAIDAIAMGPVIKVMLDFHEPFWGNERFFRLADAPIRVLWTHAPERDPLLVAWTGGGAAQRLIESGADPIRAALDSVRIAFPKIDVEGALRAAYYHDWQADPFARGAYSYLRVNGGDARAALATPIEDTLYFAGEATNVRDVGTVNGAFETGYSSSSAITM